MHCFNLGTLRLLRASSLAILAAIAASGLLFGATSAFAQQDGSESTSSDATLSTLTLSSIDFGTFDSATTSYTAITASKYRRTTVTATPNHSGASYVVQLNGVTQSGRIVEFVTGSNDISVVVTAEDEQTTRTYTVAVTRPDPSTDANLISLTLKSGDGLQVIDFGTFSPAITSYTASVPNGVTGAAALVSLSGSQASYNVFGDGVRYADGTVPLDVGSNSVQVTVYAADDLTTKTYTVTVTRAAPSSTPASNDATLSNLVLSSIDFGTFSPATTSYSVSVANSVTQTTVTPTLNQSDASYVIHLNDAAVSDDTISLTVGSNAISVVVTAEDDFTTKTYTVTVTRNEPPASDATLSNLVLSSIDFGTFDPATTSYTGKVPNRVSQTTATITLNHSGASYVIKRGGVVDSDSVISLSAGQNVISVVVTAEDDQTMKNYRVTVLRSPTPAADMGEMGTDAPSVNLRVTGYRSHYVNVAWSVPSGRSITRHEMQQFYHDGTEYVIFGTGTPYADASTGGSGYSLSYSNTGPDTLYKFVLTLKNASDATVIISSLTVRTPPPPDRDATLSNLVLSGIDFGTFASVTTSYTASIGNSVTQTTVTPTLNDSDASYFIKLNGVTDSDGTVSLAVGQNFITVLVVADDSDTTKTYAVTVTRESAPVRSPASSDASLSGLTLSGMDLGTFNSATTSYTATVSNSKTQTTVTPTLSHSSATYIVKLGDVIDSDGVIALAVGSNVITVVVTAQDRQATRTYTVTVTRSAAVSDANRANLSNLILSGIDFGSFNPDTSSYVVKVPNRVSQTTVTPTLYDSRASYRITYNGRRDSDGTVSIAVGPNNFITVVVTASDGETTKNYVVTVLRSPTPAADMGELGTDDPAVNFRVTGRTDSSVTLKWSVPNNRGITGYVLQRFHHDGTEYVAASAQIPRATATTGGRDHTPTSVYADSDTHYKFVLTLKNDSDTAVIVASATATTLPPYDGDATLSSLTLSGIDFGTFDTATTSYPESTEESWHLCRIVV